MAYEVQYTVNLTNEQNQEVLVSIAKKDGIPTIPINYQCTQFELNDNGEDQTKYNCLIVRELVLSIWSEVGDLLTWETFISSAHDDWKVTVTIDGRKYFEGFITPDEGTSVFQDQSYEVQIRATTGLALLKDIPLTDVNGDPFVSDHKLIDYIAGSLKKTGLDLPIRIYCNYLQSAMLNKGNGLEYDMFNQAYLNYRTFQSDAVTFVSCYDALKIILDKFCTLEYWNGFWQIVNIAEKQFIIGDWFYVDYDENGETPLGAQVTENHAQIGKNVDIYPINEDQMISSRFAVKSVKTKYDYQVWFELPKNNKFERGTEINSGDNGDGTTFKDFSIDDWEYGGKFTSALPSLSPTSDIAYRRSTYDAFGVEKLREIILESSGAPEKILQSEPIPVALGDKIKIDFDIRYESSGSGARQVMYAYIHDPVTNLKYYLRTGLDNVAGRIIEEEWQVGTGNAIQKFYVSSENIDQWTSISVTSPVMPITGNLYIAFMNNTSDLGARHYRSFNLEYIPLLANGYLQVKGDFYLRTQDMNFPDATEDYVSISDSPKRVLMGALLFINETVNVLTDPEWYRYNALGDPNPNNDAYGFKELLNIGRLNNAYRRMWAIEGSFNGLTYSPENDQLNIQPIGFHKRYRMVDLPAPRDFVLVPPLKMDVMRGWITASLVEVIKDENDGSQFSEKTDLQYIF